MYLPDHWPWNENQLMFARIWLIKYFFWCFPLKMVCVLFPKYSLNKLKVSKLKETFKVAKQILVRNWRSIISSSSHGYFRYRWDAQRGQSISIVSTFSYYAKAELLQLKVSRSQYKIVERQILLKSDLNVWCIKYCTLYSGKT